MTLNTKATTTIHGIILIIRRKQNTSCCRLREGAQRHSWSLRSGRCSTRLRRRKSGSGRSTRHLGSLHRCRHRHHRKINCPGCLPEAKRTFLTGTPKSPCKLSLSRLAPKASEMSSLRSKMTRYSAPWIANPSRVSLTIPSFTTNYR